MKRLLLYFAVATAVALSCTVKETERPQQNKNDKYLTEFSASIEADYSSRAEVNISTGKVSFVDGDAVTVSNGSLAATYIYNAGTGKFTPESDALPAAENYWAYYPAGQFSDLGAGGEFEVTLPDAQSYFAGLVKEAPMGAYGPGSPFTFKNLCAIIEITLNAPDETLTRVEFSAHRSISGSAVFSGTSSLSLVMDDSQAESVSVDLPAAFVPDAEKPVCLVIPAGLYPGGLEFKCSFNSGRVWYQCITSNVTIDAGYIHETDLINLGFFSGGKGTEANPYRIASKQDLLDLSEYVASSDAEKEHFKTDYYRQMADIDFDGATLNSIGNTNAEPYSYFKGSYDGNGFKVSNIAISNPTTNKAVGFFGYLAEAAHVDGLKLENVTVSASTWNVGSVVGCIQPSSTVLVENCVVTGGAVSSNNTDIGGICGKQMAGTIRGCSYSGTVTETASAKHRVGGIVGYVCVAGGLVDDCHFNGTASGACGNVGGIVGYLYGSASVTGCTTSSTSVVEGGNVANSGINIGGIVGYIDDKTGGRVENCSCSGTVKGHYYEVGGIVGRDQGLVIRGCAFSGTVTSDWNESGAADDTYGRVGGICGHIHGTGYVENCQISGNVGADDKRVSYTGGIVGWLEQGSITGCSIPSGKTLNVKGKLAVGGIVGQFKSGIVKSCTLDGLTLNANSNHAGGGAGRMYASASLTNCTLRNSSVYTSGICAGGMCGLFSGGGYISQCSVSSTTVSAGNKLAGGILGNMDSCTSAATSKVERCTVTGGSITTANENAGGILGGSNTYGAINLCSASTNVTSTAKTNVGGIVGWTNTGNMVIANCVFYGGQLSAENGSGVAGIAGQLLYDSNTMGNTIVVNCCAFPTKVSSKSNNQAGIGGYVNTVTIKNCYCPTPYTSFYYNGANTGSGSQGSIYGWLRGKATSDVCSGIMEDVYWLSGWKAGNFSGSYTYVKSEQSLTDAQMQNTGAVSRPSTGVAYGSFLEALNAAADAYNASPVFDVRAVEWVMGTNGYPVPYGTALTSSSAVSSKKRVSLLGDSITTYQGYTSYPSNYEYPKPASYPDFTSVTQTWWYQLIYNKMSNATLEVNSSYTGTQIQDHASQGHPGYGFLQRYVDLGNPDIILINGGTNDISRDLPLGSLDFSIATEDLDTYQFAQAYDKLIRLITARYPSATVLVVMGDRYFDGAKSNGAPAAEIVREICSHYSIPYAEVDYGANRSTCRYEDGTNVHPTPDGMTAMANMVWDQLQAYL